ncbi:DNA-deoxyinosine glycosylase [soil metagenome]
MTKPPDPLTGLAPIVSAQTAVLILGSFPGVRSLAAQQYYAHPQNHFWKILQAVWPQHPLPSIAEGYSARTQWLLDRGLGVWDVYAACAREGSLDSAIRDAVVNDFGGLKLPKLAAIAHNGAESYRHSQRVVAALAAGGVATLPVYKLPSTSPANASWSFDRKLDAWRDVFARHGLA